MKQELNMENYCNYSDDWQPYIGDYDKFEYDIRLKDGTVVENCYPNARKFNSISDEHERQSFEEKDVAEIRFSQRPRFMINEKVSSAKPAPEYLEKLEKLRQQEEQQASISTYAITNPYAPYHETVVRLYGYAANDPFYKRSKRRVGIPVEPRTEPKIGRNEICPKCDSGKKYKNCCLKK